ncbi:Serine/threonine-protein kinase bck1/slk1/ssp31 [Heracleum sosnowskyi]|uniref:Serine/threonine-protein kinase bck1/slk1/ssp31 n=1 Tax=Heracleum sosnowskyi TaxID=360622 RepID=A0AAD8MFE3_9APIA|nr:Serine/threonine-protein kinase bck1/slk1/ssp31 [Heracleum sosnowskyi]
MDEHKGGVENKYGNGVAWLRGPVIGKGSFGSVFVANLKWPRSKFRCFPCVMAVKSAEVSISGSIQKEKEVLSNVGRCDYVIRCFGEETTIGDKGEMVYNLLLEYGSGGTLADFIRKSGFKGLVESDVRRFARGMLRGVFDIHEAGSSLLLLSDFDDELDYSSFSDDCSFVSEDEDDSYWSEEEVDGEMVAE